MSILQRINKILGKDKSLPKNRFRMSSYPAMITEDEKFLKFRVEYEVENGNFTTVVGQIDSRFLARWGQIGDESDTEYILSVYNQNPKQLAVIVAEIYGTNPSSFPINDKGYAQVNITQEELHSREMYVN